MPKLNENYLKLENNYLFAEIAHRTAAVSYTHLDVYKRQVLRSCFFRCGMPQNGAKNLIRIT